MKAIDHLKMPSLINVDHKVVLSDSELSFYKELQDEMIAEIKDKEITSANAAVLTGKLLQVANGAVYTDSGDIIEVHERKLDALEDIIEAMSGKPLLVAYWFKHDLLRIKRRLDKLGTKYAVLDKPETIRQWNNQELEVGLIHPASAGHGLNLQSGGSTLVWFGLTWSLELYQQTIARLWRQGQSSKTVVVMHIVAAMTLDERVQRVLSGKETLQNALLSAVRANI